MKLIVLVTSLVVAGFAGVAAADPIQDGPAFAPQDVRWVQTNGGACPVVCRGANPGAQAESEAYLFPAIDNNRTHSCKSRVSVTSPSAQGFLYGNNFQAASVSGLCIVSMADGQVIRRAQYFCLCVD